MYVCICKAVTDHAIRAAVQNGTTSVSGLRKRLGCTGQCGRCREQVQEIRDHTLAALAARSRGAPALTVA
jgi:bacterioferritin-associated ferredoxin